MSNGYGYPTSKRRKINLDLCIAHVAAMFYDIRGLEVKQQPSAAMIGRYNHSLSTLVMVS